MNTQTTTQQIPVNSILHGNCIEKMRELPANSMDFILTDPPYLVNYRDRSGRSVPNDADDSWLRPAMREAYRVLKQDRVAIMFYSWTKVDTFFAAWKGAGFRPVGHIVFRRPRFKDRVSQLPARTGIPARQRPPAAARPTHRRCHRHAIYRKQAASYAKIRAGTRSPDSQLYPSGRTGSRSLCG